MSSKNYFFVGVVTFMLCCSIVVLILWKNSLFSKIKSYELIGEFESINGLLANSVVKYRGYPVGRVTRIDPTPEQIDVYFFLNDAYHIPQGSTVKIMFDGLVGEKYMEIIPNPHAKADYVAGDRIPGYSASGLSDFIDVGTQNLLELKSILATMSSIFGSEEVTSALKDTVFTMKDAVKNMNKLLEELNQISNSNKISSIIVSVDHFMANVNEAFGEEDLAKIRTTLTNLEEFSENLKELLGDKALKESLMGTLEETRSTFKQSSNFLNTIAEIKLLTSADFNYKNSAGNGSLVYFMNFNFWLGHSYLTFGFSNYFENDQLVNILLNMPIWEHTRFQYGVVKTHPGFGLDYYFDHIPFSTSLMMYRFDDPYVDVMLRYYLMESISINAGYYEVNKSSRSTLIGVSINP